MHLHVARVRRNGKVYEYAQLVESYRREDGMPTQRVVAKLGAMSPIAIANLRMSLQASREQRRVVIGAASPPARPLENLRYLDVAVLHAIWCALGIDKTLEELLPRGGSDVSPADVVAALVIQRCTDPGSKLYAERWFPRTALPELLGIAPSQFNNTRVHRVLESLDDVTERLMLRFPALISDGKPFVSLFLDATDARFVGEGPELVQLGKTKEGTIDRKVGIVLLCNEHGYPLRWSAIAGNRAETSAMHEIIGQVAGLPWVRDVPIVVDRAMGASADLEKLLGRDVRFVTALRATEIRSYTDRVPYGALADLVLGEDDNASIAEATRRVTVAGMQRVSDTMFVLDGGIVERDPARPQSNRPRSSSNAKTALLLARQMAASMQAGAVDSIAAAGRTLGITSRAAAARVARIAALSPEVQDKILEDTVTLSLRQLTEIAQAGDTETQRRVFDRMTATSVPRRTHRSAPREDQQPQPRTPIRVRLAIAFNPRRYVDERKNAIRTLERVRAEVSEENAKLSRNPHHVRRAQRNVENMLKRRQMLDLFRVSIAESATASNQQLQITAVLDVERWQRRRRHDGFSVIVAHPDVRLAPAELCKLYRAKDAVEKDFQTIKSFVELRPIRHHTDAKIRAHVTICMLALVLERALRRRLADTTAESALETFATCCLNRYGESLYFLTEPTAEQRRLLRKIQLEKLIDETETTARVRSRPHVAST